MTMTDPKRKGLPTKAERPRDVPFVDPELLALLAADEIEAIHERARKQAQLEMKQTAEKDLYEHFLEKERRKLEPEQELVKILLDLPPFAKNIRIDGRVYHHGAVYEVPRGTHDLMLEIMARGWAHDREVGQPNQDLYVPPPIGVGNYAGVKTRAFMHRMSPDNVDAIVGNARARHGV